MDFLAYFLIFIFVLGLIIAGYFYLKTENKFFVSVGLTCSIGSLISFAGMYADFSYWWWLIPLLGFLVFYWSESYKTLMGILTVLIVILYVAIVAHRVWNVQEVTLSKKSIFPQTVEQPKETEGPLFEMMRQADRKMKDLEEENKKLKETVDMLRAMSDSVKEELKKKEKEIKELNDKIKELQTPAKTP